MAATPAASPFFPPLPPLPRSRAPINTSNIASRNVGVFQQDAEEVRESIDSVRNLVDCNYSALFTSGLINASSTDLPLRSRTPSSSNANPYGLLDPSTLQTSGGKGRGSSTANSILSSLSGRKSPFKSIRRKKQSRATDLPPLPAFDKENRSVGIEEELRSESVVKRSPHRPGGGKSSYPLAHTPTKTPGKRSISSSQSSVFGFDSISNFSLPTQTTRTPRVSNDSLPLQGPLPGLPPFPTRGGIGRGAPRAASTDPIRTMPRSSSQPIHMISPTEGYNPPWAGEVKLARKGSQSHISPRKRAAMANLHQSSLDNFKMKQGKLPVASPRKRTVSRGSETPYKAKYSPPRTVPVMPRDYYAGRRGATVIGDEGEKEVLESEMDALIAEDRFEFDNVVGSNDSTSSFGQPHSTVTSNAPKFITKKSSFGPFSLSLGNLSGRSNSSVEALAPLNDTTKAAPALMPKKKRSLLGFARGGSKVPAVVAAPQEDTDVEGRRSFGFVRANAPTPPPMAPLPPLPSMMSNLSLADNGLPQVPADSAAKGKDKKQSLKPFRLRSLLNLQGSNNCRGDRNNTTPSEFSSGGWESPGEIVRPGTSLGTYTPSTRAQTVRHQETPASRPSFGSFRHIAGPFTPDVTPIYRSEGFDTGATPTPLDTRTIGRTGTYSSMVPPRPKSRPSLEIGARPSMSDIPTRALSPDMLPRSRTPLGTGAMRKGLPVNPMGKGRIPLIPRATSTSVLSVLASLSSNGDSNTRAATPLTDDSPSSQLPFKAGVGDEWGTPYPAPEFHAYPFPAVTNANRDNQADIGDQDELDLDESLGSKPRSRFDSGAFEYQDFETDDSSTFDDGKATHRSQLSTSSSFAAVQSSISHSSYSRPVSRFGGLVDERIDEDKEYADPKSSDLTAADIMEGQLSIGRRRPLPRAFTSRSSESLSR